MDTAKIIDELEGVLKDLEDVRRNISELEEVGNPNMDMKELISMYRVITDFSIHRAEESLDRLRDRYWYQDHQKGAIGHPGPSSSRLL